MNRRTFVLSASAIVMALMGFAASFAPDEIARSAGMPDDGLVPLIIQLTGALYLSFAMANWMARQSLIGGIYARPLALGNFLHFAMGALALVRHLPNPHAAVLVLTIIYAIFALAFGAILFSNPLSGAGASGPRVE